MSAPDFKIIGLSVWVLSRGFDSSDDYWDGNWLLVRALCEAHGAVVETTGPILHLGELEQWLHELRAAHSSLNGIATLECTEPNLSVSLSLTQGNGELVVDLTPNHMMQKHRFRFEIDQSYLPALCSELERLLARYPIRGQR